MRRIVASLALAAMLGACVPSPSYVRSAPAPAAAARASVAPPLQTVSRDATGIIGERAGSLTRRFGQARIDLAEGDARKLQFASGRCVLDIYLYPIEAGSQPVATHIETRLREGGAPTDAAGCIEDVERAARG